MKNIKKMTVMEIIFSIYVLFLLILSSSMVFMPLQKAGPLEEKEIIILAAVLFWAGLAGTMLSGFVFCYYRKKNSPGNKKTPAEIIKRSGIINFFGNPFAAVSDILLILSTALIIAAMIFEWDVYIKSYIVTVFVFSFGMHCMLNGINFKYILFQKQNRRGKKL